MIFNKNLPTSMRIVGAKVVRTFGSVLPTAHHLFAPCLRANSTCQQHRKIDFASVDVYVSGVTGETAAHALVRQSMRAKHVR